MAKNKLVRSDNFTSIRAKASRTKSALRKERAKLEEKDPTLRVRRQRDNVPLTIEQKRRYDPARFNDSKAQVTQMEAASQPAPSEEDDHEATQILGSTTTKIKNEDEEDEQNSFSSVRTTESGMRTLITTSPNPTKISYHFLEILRSIFPLSETIRRGSHKYTISDIAKYASNRGYSTLIVINEDQKSVNAINFISLPDGPTAYFTITNLQTKQLATHTTHHPELILQNFTTALGTEIAGIFKGLMPKEAHIQGRQIVTLHNSRDFIFFRRHRYMFTGAGDRVRLQEIGPRFTLKCREVVDGIGRNGALKWRSNASLESDRKRMFL